MSRKRLGVALRFLVSAGLVWFLVTRVNWREIGAMVKRTDLYYVSISFAVGILLNTVSSWKWRILLGARGRNIPLRRLLNLYFVGYFFNNFLPSNVGGDVVRGFEAGKDIDDTAMAMASVFMERFTGLTALIMLAVVSFVTNLQRFQDVRFSLALALGLLAYLFIIIAVLYERPLAWGRERFAGAAAGRFVGKLIRLQTAIKAYAGHRSEIAKAMVLSVVFYILAIVNVYVSALAFGTSVSLPALIVIVPVVLVISMLPISLGGVGLTEWAYFFTFSAVGAGGSPGMLTALLTRTKALVFSLYGGLYYAISGAGKGVQDDV